MKDEATVRRIRDGLMEMARLEKQLGNDALALTFAERAAMLTWVLGELPDTPNHN